MGDDSHIVVCTIGYEDNVMNDCVTNIIPTLL